MAIFTEDTPYTGQVIQFKCPPASVEPMRPAIYREANHRGCTVTTAKTPYGIKVTVTSYTSSLDKGYKHPRQTITKRLRKLLADNLHHAGDTVSFRVVEYKKPTPFNKVVHQAAAYESMEVEVRKIDSHYVIRRKDITHPAPGENGYDYELTAAQNHFANTVRSFRPWPNDPDYDRKMTALGVIAQHIETMIHRPDPNEEVTP